MCLLAANIILAQQQPQVVQPQQQQPQPQVQPAQQQQQVSLFKIFL